GLIINLVDYKKKKEKLFMHAQRGENNLSLLLIIFNKRDYKMKYLLSSILLLALSNVSFAQGEERLLRINGTEINIRTFGNGSPILVVHGGPGLNHSYFLPQFETLASNHRLIFIDQRACGKSAGSLDSTQMSLDWFVKDMEAVRKELKLGKVSVLAHSWGGLLGMLYASRYPESIRTLIISNSVSPKAGEYDKQTNEIISSRYTKEDSTLSAQTLKSNAFKEGDLEAYKVLFKVSFKQSFYNRSYIDSLNLTLPSDFVQKRNILFLMAKELSDYNFYPDLKKIKCETLIIHGDYDAIPIELAQNINKSIHTSKLAVIKDAGHFPFIEQKAAFFNVVEDFLAKK
ncbi:MAG TPA: alpha/beta fold hydrolase, partial [Ignavibacteriaceae bacterium]